MSDLIHSFNNHVIVSANIIQLNNSLNTYLTLFTLNIAK